jgi:hypothetical protein
MSNQFLKKVRIVTANAVETLHPYQNYNPHYNFKTVSLLSLKNIKTHCDLTDLTVLNCFIKFIG